MNKIKNIDNIEFTEDGIKIKLNAEIYSEEMIKKSLSDMQINYRIRKEKKYFHVHITDNNEKLAFDFIDYLIANVKLKL